MAELPEVKEFWDYHRIHGEALSAYVLGRPSAPTWQEMYAISHRFSELKDKANAAILAQQSSKPS